MQWWYTIVYETDYHCVKQFIYSYRKNSIKAKKWFDIDLKGKIAVVLGSEGKGIRQLVLKTCDFHATIPM